MSVELPLATRLAQSLQEGISVEVASSRQGISASLGHVIVDDLLRRGLLSSAGSLCTSGLGACSGRDSAEAKVICAGCPLAAL